MQSPCGGVNRTVHPWLREDRGGKDSHAAGAGHSLRDQAGNLQLSGRELVQPVLLGATPEKCILSFSFDTGNCPLGIPHFMRTDTANVSAQPSVFLSCLIWVTNLSDVT